MKKLTPLMLLLVLFACDESELFIEPGEEMSVAVVEVPKPTSLDQVFMVVEEQPSYPGGNEAWFKHLSRNLNYPVEAKKNGVEGAVYLSFVVDKTGELRDIQVIKGVGHGCNEEALRVLMASENWNPGKQRGVEVSSRMQLRIVFKLPDGADGPAAISHETTEVIVETIDNLSKDPDKGSR